MLRLRDKRAEQWLRTKSTSLLSGLQVLWTGQVQRTIASGLERGINPNSVGLELAGRINRQTGKREGGSVSLGELELGQVSDFRRCLVELDQTYFEYDLRNKRSDKTVHLAICEKKPLELEKITTLVNQFEAKLLKHQYDILVRTEMLSAINRSAYLSVKKSIDDSGMSELASTRIWNSCGDDKVRPSHKALDGQCLTGFSECFVSPITGAKMMYPGDISLGAPDEEIRGCRCRVIYRTDFAYGEE